MIKFENTRVVGWDSAIRGMRNPKNSWDKSDSEEGCEEVPGSHKTCGECNYSIKCRNGYACSEGEEQLYVIGPNDIDLMKRLAAGGPVHAKYRRMIVVYVDITAPLYWWKEFDTYKVGTVANSCSTMHKIAAKEFERGDFSHEHLITPSRLDLDGVIEALNEYRDWYLRYDSMSDKDKAAFIKEITCKKDLWWQMIQLLPSSYNQKRTIMLNYEVLAGIYPMRKNHKLDEWSEHEPDLVIRQGDDVHYMYPYHGFCDWIKTLPYSELITGDTTKTVELFADGKKVAEFNTPNESLYSNQQQFNIEELRNPPVEEETIEELLTRTNAYWSTNVVTGERCVHSDIPLTDDEKECEKHDV